MRAARVHCCWIAVGSGPPRPIRVGSSPSATRVGARSALKNGSSWSSFPPFRLDLDEGRLWKGEKLLVLRRKPFAILRYLAAHPRKLVTHEELLAQVWGGAVVSDSAMRSHLHELRQVLGEGVIETVIGRGYRFVAELSESAVVPRARRRSPTSIRSSSVATRSSSMLRAALERARAGRRQLCFVTGEPGIGKSTLVRTFLAESRSARR